MNSGNDSRPAGKNSLHDRLTVPLSLRTQLKAFRDRVWTTKVAEAIFLAVAGLLLAFLTVYGCDRFLDTPRQARYAIFFGSLALWLALPRAIHYWVWRNRRLEELARLLRVREPAVGDQLLSVIELAGNDSEQARSRSLCAAAILQVAESAKGRDFRQAAPPTRLRSLSVMVSLALVATMALAVFFPAAAQNAWARFSAPWRDTPRFTFTTIQPLAPTRVVPHGEATQFAIQLTDDSRSRPASARVRIDRLPAAVVPLTPKGYVYQLPAQTNPVALKLNVGDFSQVIRVEPKLRPELIAAVANISLPPYLERPEPVQLDVRSGALNAVMGSQAQIVATASRPLNSASINRTTAHVEQDKFYLAPVDVSTEQQLSMEWTDFDGLSGSEPFELTVTPLVDELPSIIAQDFPRQAVVLDSEQINFQALAADDFGVKRIGISWQGIEDSTLTAQAAGEKVLSAGGPMQKSMQVPATFSATSLGIEPQPIEVRLWAEDYMPGRERVYSSPHLLFVLTAEEHAIWITSQMSKWHRSALDVRDTELQLFEANKRLRAMSDQELGDEALRGEIRRQASLEASNGRRLSALANTGESLLRQAARNPEVGVGHLDRWAEMLQILNDIGTSRMPSVSELLDKEASSNSLTRASTQKPTAPMAGQVRSAAGGNTSPQEEDEKTAHPPQMPKIVDMESSQQPLESQPDSGEQNSQKKKGSGSRLSLPNTTLAGPPSSDDDEKEVPEEEPEQEAAFDEALFEQEDLLAEFEKVADELNTILANLEGSTLVKRLKAASREQDQVAERIGMRINAVFGRVAQAAPEDRELLNQLADIEETSSVNISYIMDDMHSYFERRRMNQFKVVLDEMKDSEVLVALRSLGEEIPREQGLSIAQAEYWSDTLDRWAEDLVDPACSGQCPGSKTSDALPPSVILEVLKILENEVNLREQTRVAEQARPAIETTAHEQEAVRLSQSQEALQARTDAVVESILALPMGDQRFGKEIELLSSVSFIMTDAGSILASPDTGSRAIAAETEAIELLLQCKRINPKGGGGGGSSPGGGGSGTTQDSALALLGSGLNQNERREPRDVTQATGETGQALPEEFRAGLDEYFNRIEQAN